mmetsp:Transcript_91152/g.262937  ORF Transcript_91152/g.262937 Transcript_91152/m.262937 type:complete len:560 (-) Transcript_91152:54-1733(-)
MLMAGAISARSMRSEGGSARKRTLTFEPSGSSVAVGSSWQAEVLLRLQKIEQRIEALDLSTVVPRAPMSPTSAAAAGTRSMPRVNFADHLFEAPECPVPQAPQRCGDMAMPTIYGLAEDGVARAGRTDRSEASLSMPMGDRFVLDAPTWELFPPAPEVMEEEAGQSKLTTGKEASASPSRSADRSPRVAGKRTSVVTSVEEVKERNNKRSKMLETVWNVLDDPEYSRLSALYAGLMPYIIMFSVIAAILQTPTPPTIEGPLVITFDILVELVFGFEFTLRALSCPAKRMFFYNYNNTIDLLAALPLFFRAALGAALVESSECGSICTVLMCFVPVIRALKALRRFESLQLLINASQKASEGLPVCLFALFVLTLLFASLIYIVEPRSNIQSLPHAMWLTIVTMTTVGYGDVTPETLAGSMIVSVLVVFSVLYMAMPLGIVGNAFTEVWQDREFILLRHRTNSKLRQWGYGAHDVPMLFELFDEDKDGELNIAEFVTMMEEIRIGLTPKRITQLFETLDADGGGTIDDREFIRSVFPEEFDSIFDGAESEDQDLAENGEE